MSESPFWFKSLDIRQMPGFPKGLRHYEAFHPQINIIAGPNASGKSSTAAALQHILWPHLSDNLQVKARISIAEEEWVVEKQMSHTTIQREGKDEELPARPSAEERRRYLLALHDLMRVEDKQLAQLIIQESVGGYDLERASRELNYSNRISSRGTKQYRNYQDAIQNYEDTYKKQSTLKQRQQKLSELKKQVNEAERALSLDKLYELYQKYLQACNELKRLNHQLEDFPEGLSRATGEESEQLRNIEEAIDDIESDNQTLNHEIEQAREKLEEINLPSSGISQQKIDLLGERAKRLQSLQDKIDDNKSNAEEEREKARNALQSLQAEDMDIDPGDFSTPDFSELEEWFQQVYQVTGRRRLMKDELEKLQDEQSADVFKSDTIKEGLKLLERWIRDRSRDTKKGYPVWAFWSLLLLGFATTLATYLWGAAGLWGFLVMGLLVFYVFMRHSNSASLNEQRYVEDYRSTGLPVPEQWELGEVVKTIDQLAEELAASYRENHREIKIEQLESDIQRLEKGELKNLHDLQKRWQEAVKVVPRLLDEGSDSYSRFYWYMNRLNQWQQAIGQARGFEKAAEQFRQKQGEVYENISGEIEQLELEKPEDPEEAEALANRVQRKEQQRKEMTRRIEDKSQQLEQNKREIDRLKKQARQIYDKFGLADSAIDEVERRLQMFDSYQDTLNQYNEAEYRMKERLRELEAHSQYDSYREQLEQMDIDKIKRERGRLQKKAEEREKLQKEIHEIQSMVRKVKEDHDLEEALQQKEEALENLENLYRDNVTSFTGYLLSGKLKQITKDQNRPAVFNKATELFNRITNGQYQLLIDEEGPRFRAYDTIQDRGRSLEQLSTGTRIQLLLAVRLAFIETQEQSIPLPLLADELLANSDDVRAKAIIQALVKMSQEGRQIFYFTAQADEVYKWRSFLEDKDIGYQLYEVGRESGSGFAYYQTYRPPRNSLQLTGKVPPPEGDDHWEYGQELSVPVFDLLTDRVSRLHLWYVMEDVDLLYKCLKRQIRFWGGLRNYLDYGGVISGLDEEKFQQIQDRVKWLERFQNLYQQGRPKPIGRSVIEATDAVTDNFLEEVAEKLEEVEGDPDRLLEALRNSEVSGFRKAKIEELETYLLEHGYMDDNDPVPLEEIRSRLQAYLDQLSISREDAERLLDRILKQ